MDKFYLYNTTRSGTCKHFFKAKSFTIWFLVYILIVHVGVAQITATTTVTKKSANATTDSGVESKNMVYLNYRSAFRLHADNSGGIIADNFGTNGKVTISVYNYDRDQSNGKGALVYKVFSDISSTGYVQKTTNEVVEITTFIDLNNTYQITVKSNDIKKMAQQAKLYAPFGCRKREKLIWTETIYNIFHPFSTQIEPGCAEFYKPTLPVIIEAAITNATLHKFKIPGIGELDASGFFSYQDKVKSLTSSNSPRFAIIGDEGCAGDNAANVAALVKAWNPDFIVGMGDDNYEDVHAQFGTCGGNIDENCGQYYHDYIYPYHGTYGNASPNSTNRFWTILGNHDYKSIFGKPANYLPNEWLNFFTYPNNERYYDKRIGDVHLFALNTNVRSDGTAEDPDGRSATSTQGVWLQQKLQATDAKYRIVFGHVPPYAQANPDGSHGSDPVLQWPYESWGASVVLSGDQHYYERNVVNGFNYVINGLGGHIVINRQQTQPIPIPAVTTAVHYNTTYGAMLAEVGATWITCTFYDLNYHQVDQFTIPVYTPPVNVARIHGEQETAGSPAKAEPEDILVYPNPTAGKVKIALTVKEATPASIELVKISGVRIRHQEYDLLAGRNDINLDNLELTEGVYLLHILTGNVGNVRKILIE